MTKTKEQKVTYHIIFTNGNEKKITIPRAWKVTFGSKHPGGKGYDNESVLRLYENETRQRAAFVGVQTFVAISEIEMSRKVINLEERTKITNDKNMKKEDH